MWFLQARCGLRFTIINHKHVRWLAGKRFNRKYLQDSFKLEKLDNDVADSTFWYTETVSTYSSLLGVILAKRTSLQMDFS